MNEFGRTKESINSFEYLYGLSVDKLPVSREDRIAMHTVQAQAAKGLYDKLYDDKRELSKELLACNLHIEKGRERYDRLYDQMTEIASRMRSVKEAQDWNDLMLKALK